jgi:hypothetical protein
MKRKEGSSRFGKNGDVKTISRKGAGNQVKK